MGKNKNGRMADRAHDAVTKVEQDLDKGIDDVRDFNERVEGKAKNMASKTHEKVRNDAANMKKRVVDTADKIDQDVSDKAMSRMKERHS
ncbi:hypothetical protein [Catelliglobosispora koreensis]|uniref:hypothetical protein n=1 Tax=Catelliglobosispora koreensis TaxID=129052 RepID=UPI00038100D3|nr:hypothetical protein [Catelliglobosispora koreensis]